MLLFVHARVVVLGGRRAYDRAAVRYHKKEALLNFPDDLVRASWLCCCEFCVHVLLGLFVEAMHRTFGAERVS